MNDALNALRNGARAPYDDTDGANADAPRPANDWAHAAARGVIDALLDRSGFDSAFDLDEDLRVEIVEEMTAIIRLAAEDGHGAY